MKLHRSPTRGPGPCPGLLFAALGLLPLSLHAQQLTGRVLTEGGNPLPATTVEVWGRAVILYTTSSEAGGWFTVPDLRDSGATRYVFRYLGRRVQIIQKEDLRDGSVVRLALGPDYRMDGLAVTVARNVCPLPDEPAARARWERAAGHYNQDTSHRGISGYYQAEMRDVNENDLFQDIDGAIHATLAMGESWRAGVRAEYGTVLTLEDMARARGYAWKREFNNGPEQFLGRDRHLNWLYAELDTRSAYHFATQTFGSLHTFAVVTEDESGMRIQFCPRRDDDDPPSIRGTLLVGPDDELVEAEWRFRTKDPDEGAGGWVRFGTRPDPGGGVQHLVADRGMFFRHNGFEKPYPNQPRWLLRDLRDWPTWVISATEQEPALDGPGGGPR